MKHRDRGFTLVELLVVVTIIVILIAMLIPTLEQARVAAERAKCLSNLHAIGRASSLYLNDNKNTYAGVYHWHGLLGKYGVYEPGSTSHPQVLNPGLRPLNAYLGYPHGSTQMAPGAVPFTATGVGIGPAIDPMEVPVAECPSDVGDPLWGGSNNAYKEFGTSYIVTVIPYHFHIGQLFGNLQAPGAYPSAKSTQIKPLASKVLVTDWPVYGNRWWSNSRTRWHSNDPNKREINTAFADGHAELTEYELDKIDGEHGGTDGPPNPSWHWW